MRNTVGVLTFVGLAGLFNAAPSLADNMPAPFQLEKGVKMQIVDIKHPDDVKVCVDATGVPAGVKVNYDGKEKVVAQGNCIQIEAKSVSVHATDDLPKGLVVTGVYTVD